MTFEDSTKLHAAASHDWAHLRGMSRHQIEWPPRFLFVGTERDRENGDRVLATFGRLRQRFPEAVLEVVGEDHKQLLSAIVELRDPQRACGLDRRAHERAELLMWRLVAERLVRAARIPGADTASPADCL